MNKAQWESFHRIIGSKVTRKIKARREAQNPLWFGFGTIGLIGWSIAVPMLIGTIVGFWLDQRWHKHFCTLGLMLAGLILGCLNAWNWINKEDALMHENQEKSND